MRSISLYLVLPLLISAVIAGCKDKPENITGPPAPISAVQADRPQEPEVEIPEPYQVNITPAAQAYEIPRDLSTVTNLDKIDDLANRHKRQLVKNGFVVIPDTKEQIFMLYEEYNWGEDEDTPPMPNFVTVDSVLHLYHVFFDYSLRTVEQTQLYQAAVELTDLCLQAAADQCAAAPDSLKDAARRNLAYFGVAKSLLAGSWEPPADLPSGAASLVAEELPKIKDHAQRLPSPIMERTVHYTQFNPRGHYTRTETLQNYFRGLMWYGLVGFELDKPPDKPELIRRHQQQALLITKLVSDSEEIQGLWATMYEPSKFFVGGADDLTYQQYLPVVNEVFGQQFTLQNIADVSQVDEFIIQARAKLPKPRIAPAFLEADARGQLETVAATPQGRQFRFMGQRFIPDSYALQELVYPLVGGLGKPRYMPKGLDVMAVLGSPRARDIMLEVYDAGQFAHYESQLDKLIDEFAATPLAKWISNMYWGWLHSFRPLLEERGEGYPTFMRNQAWVDKELNTSLGSWAELRHDTILYGKQSGAELGGPPWIPVKGYVEPYPEVYARLAYLAHLSRTGLQEQGILPEKLAKQYENLEDLLLFLKSCSEKILTNQPLTDEEYERIQAYGGELERLMLSVVQTTGEQWGALSSWFAIQNEADRYMACIADVHTSFDKVLEEAVGYAYPIYVIVPHPDGGLQVARGGVFSYYEFEWSASDRLTDEKWIEMLKASQEPDRPQWTTSFIIPGPPGWSPPDTW